MGSNSRQQSLNSAIKVGNIKPTSEGFGRVLVREVCSGGLLKANQWAINVVKEV